MSRLVEGELEIWLPKGASGRSFDDPATHGLSHCMQAVDFIVELRDVLLFIEIKDPEQSRAPTQERREYVSGFLSGKIDQDLARKYPDSFVYEWAADGLKKPVHYRCSLPSNLWTTPCYWYGRTRSSEPFPSMDPLTGPGGDGSPSGVWCSTSTRGINV